MKQISLVLLFFVCGLISQAQPTRVMLVTGGHAYDTLQFFQMFDKLEDIEYVHFEQPAANKQIAQTLAHDYDVIVFYDMWQEISRDEKQAYLKMVEEGKPFLFLHHSLVSYQKWPDFEKLIGGKYVEKVKGISEEDLSNYEHDVWVYCQVVNSTTVTAGLSELRLFDEIYGNVRISEDVVPLLRTTHPKSMEYIAWENRYRNSRILYIQPGHDRRTYQENDYQNLLQQAIRYLAKR